MSARATGTSSAPLLVPGALLLALTARTSAGADGGPSAAAQDGELVEVVAGFYALPFLAERVGGDAVRVESLAPTGAEPHDLELGPQQVARVSEADLVLHLAGFQPALDEAVAQQAAERALDAATVTPLVDGDPHVWLDPSRMAALTDAVAERLATAAPAEAAGVRERAAALRAELTALDGELRRGLETCERREVVTSHAAPEGRRGARPGGRGAGRGAQPARDAAGRRRLPHRDARRPRRAAHRLGCS